MENARTLTHPIYVQKMHLRVCAHLVLMATSSTRAGAISLEARSGSSYAPIHPHPIVSLLQEHALLVH